MGPKAGGAHAPKQGQVRCSWERAEWSVSFCICGSQELMLALELVNRNIYILQRNMVPKKSCGSTCNVGDADSSPEIALSTVCCLWGVWLPRASLQHVWRSCELMQVQPDKLSINWHDRLALRVTMLLDSLPPTACLRLAERGVCHWGCLKSAHRPLHILKERHFRSWPLNVVLKWVYRNEKLWHLWVSFQMLSWKAHHGTSVWGHKKDQTGLD